MSSFSQTIVCGALGTDPELRYTQSGRPVCNLSVATNEEWTDQQGQRHQETEWHKIVVWGKQGENCNQYLSKGRSVLVSGRIRTEEWNDRDGVVHRSQTIVAREVTFLPGGSSQSSQGGHNTSQQNNTQNDTAVGGPEFDPDDDIPF